MFSWIRRKSIIIIISSGVTICLSFVMSLPLMRSVFTVCQFVDKDTSQRPFSLFIRSFVLSIRPSSSKFQMRPAMERKWQKEHSGGDCICLVNTRLNRFNRQTEIYYSTYMYISNADNPYANARRHARLFTIQHIRKQNQMTTRKTTQNVCILLDGHLLRVFIKNQQPKCTLFQDLHLAHSARWQTQTHNAEPYRVRGRPRCECGNSVPRRTWIV